MGQIFLKPKIAFTKMYLPVWLEAKRHCLDVDKAMPEALNNIKPPEYTW